MPDQDGIVAELEPFVADCERLIKGKTWSQVLERLKALDPPSRSYYFGMHWFLSPAEKYYLTPVFLYMIFEHTPGKISPLSFLAELEPTRCSDLDGPALDWKEFYSLFSTDQKEVVARVLEQCAEYASPGAAAFWRHNVPHG
jgi:hypothetical protein